jgi:REP element-mobilizing transposase RayT
VYSPDEIAIVHVMNRVVRGYFLMGADPLTGKNYDHRKKWIESLLQRFAAIFGIDLLCFAIMSNHFHLILRSRPDVVETWDSTEVARRWMLLCPKRKEKDGSAKEPSEAELNVIRNDAKKLKQIRRRLSDISWWMRLLCQRVAQNANREEEAPAGKFWQNRFRSVRLLDEEAILACAAYVDLNPIRAAMAEKLEESQHTSVLLRLETLADDCQPVANPQPPSVGAEECVGSRPDSMLSPVEIDELHDTLGAQPCSTGDRCSQKGFLPMSAMAYVQLLDWTARQLATGKPGCTPADAPPILKRLRLEPTVWCTLVSQFRSLFGFVAGRPQRVDNHRSSRSGNRFSLPQATRELLTA